MARVLDIIAKPFKTRSHDDKASIMLAGKPRPQFDLKIQIYEGNQPKIIFNVLDLYNQEEWLTGCDKRNSLFCWPCLLFCDERGLWNSSVGYSDFKFLGEAVKKHKQALYHVQAMLIYHLFLNRLNVPSNKKTILISQEDLAKANRKLAMRIVDVVCHAVLQQFPPLKLTNGSKQFLVEDCIHDLNLLSSRWMPEQDTNSDVIKLIRTSPSVLTDMVSAITSVLKGGIKKEARQSTFVSLILSEHLDNNNSYKSKISTVLRYVIHGKAYERFLGFTNFNQYKTANIIYEHISKVVQEFDLAEKFVAYACDAAVLASNYHLNSLKTKLRDDYPFYRFVPCHFHKLHNTLVQSLSKMKECNLFFKKVNSVKDFFQNNPKACSALVEFSGENVFEFDNNEWCNSRFLGILKTRRRQFLKFFKSVVDNCEYWEAEDLPKALAFQQMLQEFETIFLLEAFTKIFAYIFQLNVTLSSNVPEAAFGGNLPEFIKSSLEKEREESAFENFWVAVVSEILEAQEPKPISLKTAMEPEKKLLHREFFLKIIDAVIQEIDYRFGSSNKLLFFHILNCEKHGKFVYSSSYIESLLMTYGIYFKEAWLKNEIRVLCSNNPMFSGKSLYELMEFFVSANLQTTFTNLFKLAELTLTMPCKPPSVEGHSKLDKIHSWCWVTGEGNVCDFSSLCIEEEFLNELKSGKDFLNDVFLKFLELNKSVQPLLF